MTKFLEFFKKAAITFSDFYAKNYLFLEVIIVLILGLIPLLWFKSPSEIVIGHDSGFPISAVEWFTNRLSAWTEKYNFGSDQSLAFGSLPIHVLEAGLEAIGFSIYAVQKIVFIFWFVLPGLSMYILSRYLLGSEKKYSVFRITASVFYMLNHFLLQGWFIAERTKFSIIAAVPLVVLFFLKGLDEKMPKLQSIFLANLVLFFLNGGGSGFTLYGGLGIILLSISLGYLVNKKISLSKLLGYVFSFGFVFFLLNSYWIIPQILYTLSNYSTALSSFGGSDSLISWANEVSKHTSIINLIRLQGIPDWYDSPLHPYANTFLNNPIFIAISYLIPIFAGLAFLIYSRKKVFNKHMVWLFILVLLGIVFTAGTHPPFGFIYEFLLKNIPLFSVFRTPFYKFGYSLWFAYSILVALSVNYLFRLKAVSLNLLVGSKNQQKVSLPWEVVGTILLILITLIYNYPFFTGSFFKWRDPLTTKVELPSYVLDYKKWLAEQEDTSRTLLLPELNNSNPLDIYNWGYYSLETLPALLSSKGVIANNFSISTGKDEKELIELTYDSLKNSPETFDELTRKLGINRILLRKDVFYNYQGAETDSPADVESLLAQTSFKPTQTFGEWVIYQNGNHMEPIQGYSQIAEIQYGETTNLEIIKAILSEIGDLPYSRFLRRPVIENSQKLIFLDNSNVSEISEDQNTITYDLPYQPSSAELVINPQSASETNYNVGFSRSGNTLNVNLSTPEITITYGNKTKKVEPKTLSKSLSLNSNAEIGVIINDQIFNLSDTGSVKISAGSDKITITVFEKASSSGILSDLKFETDNIQDKTGSCGGESSNVSGSLTQSSTSDGKYIELSGEKASSCLRLPVETGNGVYKLSFDYLWSSGENPSFCVLQQSDASSVCLPEITIENSTKGKWQKFETVFASASDVKKLILHFYAKSDQEKTTIGYDNIRLEKINKLSEGEVSILDLSTLQGEKTVVDLENLNTGVLKISSKVDGEKIENISDGSFENSLWGGAFICGEDSGQKPNVFASFSDDRTDGERSIELSSQSGTACVRSRVANFDKKNLYKLSFDYKNLTGDAPSFCLLQLDSDKECFPNQELKKSSRWQNYSTYFIPETDATALVLHLYSSTKSSNLFDNVKIESVERPYSLAYLKDFSEPESGSVETSVVDSSSTNYKVRVNSLESTYVLALDQSFSSNWKAYLTEKNTGAQNYLNFLLGREIPESLHIKLNGITNGWVITDAKPGQEISIEYLPQKVFTASVILSGMAFLIVLIVSSARFVKTNYKEVKMKLWKEEGKLKEFGKKIESIVVEP